MPLQKDFTVLVTDEEFRQIVHEALVERNILSRASKLDVVNILWIRAKHRWEILCKKPSDAPKAGGQ